MLEKMPQQEHLCVGYSSPSRLPGPLALKGHPSSLKKNPSRMTDVDVVSQSRIGQLWYHYVVIISKAQTRPDYKLTSYQYY